jgi:hypothetical protein
MNLTEFIWQLLLTQNKSFPLKNSSSQIVQQEALTRFLVEEGILSKEEFWEIVRMVDQEMEKRQNETV